MEWYFYVNSTQVGPLAEESLRQILEANILPPDSLVFKAGWKGWEPLQRAVSELILPNHTEAPPQIPQPAQQKKTERPPRAEIRGKVIVHNNQSLAQGTPVNVSVAGIFFETEDKPFEVGESLKLTCQIEALNLSFQAQAKVIRYADPLDKSSDSKLLGCGLAFENLDPKISEQIHSLLDKKPS